METKNIIFILIGCGFLGGIVVIVIIVSRSGGPTDAKEKIHAVIDDAEKFQEGVKEFFSTDDAAKEYVDTFKAALEKELVENQDNFDLNEFISKFESQNVKLSQKTAKNYVTWLTKYKEKNSSMYVVQELNKYQGMVDSGEFDKFATEMVDEQLKHLTSMVVTSGSPAQKVLMDWIKKSRRPEASSHFK